MWGKRASPAGKSNNPESPALKPQALVGISDARARPTKFDSADTNFDTKFVMKF
jgi:hypothetical protein